MIIGEKNLIEQLNCPEELLPVIRKLKSPRLIQNYIGENFTYNHSDTTYRSFIEVMKTYNADCFEGGIGFAYPLLYLWGYHPQIVLIHADHEKDVDHNLVTYRYKNRLGAIAMSSYKELLDRLPLFDNMQELIMSYYHHYTCPDPRWFNEYTVIGYSDPVDLVKKFGTGWFFLPGETALKYLYDHYMDGVMCTPVFTGERYPYPGE